MPVVNRSALRPGAGRAPQRMPIRTVAPQRDAPPVPPARTLASAGTPPRCVLVRRQYALNSPKISAARPRARRVAQLNCAGHLGSSASSSPHGAHSHVRTSRRAHSPHSEWRSRVRHSSVRGPRMRAKQRRRGGRLRRGRHSPTSLMSNAERSSSRQSYPAIFRSAEISST